MNYGGLNIRIQSKYIKSCSEISHDSRGRQSFSLRWVGVNPSISEYPGHILGRDFGIVPAMKAHDGRLTATLLQAIYESLGELPPILTLIWSPKNFNGHDVIWCPFMFLACPIFEWTGKSKKSHYRIATPRILLARCDPIKHRLLPEVIWLKRQAM